MGPVRGTTRGVGWGWGGVVERAGVDDRRETQGLVETKSLSVYRFRDQRHRRRTHVHLDFVHHVWGPTHRQFVEGVATQRYSGPSSR